MDLLQLKWEKDRILEVSMHALIKKLSLNRYTMTQTAIGTREIRIMRHSSYS